ncbi:hypothetical protein [Paenibacillus validus]|uniref:LysM domain-containing protein n=1 Tax=Paenibacillus validus TaxID=44253 RepID=A0A7X2ZE06_9BACL|nr:hypothetical protein [Paenibacillus validus]MUG73083.1 hypothetical protein [Paenibacillus validus]
MSKKRKYAAKALVSSLALSLLLGGGAVYGFSSRAQAAASGTAAVSEASSSQTANAHAEKANPKDWFGGKRGDKTEAGKSEKPHGKHAGHAIVEEAAAVLGMSQEELRSAWKDKTLVQIAADRKISEADLVSKLKAVRVKRLDEAVAAGKLTADQAALMKEKLDAHLTFIAGRKFSELGKHSKHKTRMLPAPDKLAAILGITEAELKSQLKDGKSLADIAQTKGISKDQLVAKIKEELTPWIEKAVERKHSPGDKQGQEKK